MTSSTSTPFRGIFLPLVLALTVHAAAEGSRHGDSLASNTSDRGFILEPTRMQPSTPRMAATRQDAGASLEEPVRYELASTRQDAGATLEEPVRFELASTRQDAGAALEEPVRYELASTRQDAGAALEEPERFELAGTRQDGFSTVTIRDLGKRYAQNLLV